MHKKQNNYAFIDSQNLNLAIQGNYGVVKFKMFRPHLRYMNDLEYMLAYKKKRPRKDETLKGDSSVGD